MKYRVPTIPFELLPTEFPPDWSEKTLQLWEEVIAEVEDENYFWQGHYKRQTFDNGCRGPMCRKFVRDASRSRPRSNKMYPPRPDRIYDPVVDLYRIVILKLETERRIRDEYPDRLKGSAI